MGAYLAITFGAILPMLYLIWPTEVQDYASEIGWGGFIVSLIGMLFGSVIQNIFQPKVEEEKHNGFMGNILAGSCNFFNYLFYIYVNKDCL